MLHRTLVVTVLAAGIALLPSLVLADAHRGTLAEAEAMLDQAIAHYEQVGREQALADFTAQQQPFKDRDLYVFCFGADRTIVAHGANAASIGIHFDESRDVDGKEFGTAIWDTGSQAGGGTVEYQWLNPVSGEVEPKISFVRRAGDDVCGVGAYHPD